MANPFRDGAAERRPVKEIVKYTFAALAGVGAGTQRGTSAGRDAAGVRRPPGGGVPRPGGGRAPVHRPVRPCGVRLRAAAGRRGGRGARRFWSGWKRRRNSRCRRDLGGTSPRRKSGRYGALREKSFAAAARFLLRASNVPGVVANPGTRISGDRSDAKSKHASGRFQAAVHGRHGAGRRVNGVRPPYRRGQDDGNDRPGRRRHGPLLHHLLAQRPPADGLLERLHPGGLQPDAGARARRTPGRASSRTRARNAASSSAPSTPSRSGRSAPASGPAASTAWPTAASCTPGRWTTSATAVREAAEEVLTPRQQRILQMSCEGWSVHEMAGRAGAAARARQRREIQGGAEVARHLSTEEG